MARVYVVRHARPDPASGNAGDPATWGLGEAGRREATELGRAQWWAGVGTVVTSPEPKARETAGLAAAPDTPILVDSDLAEVRRPRVVEAAFADVVAAYLRGEAVAGWEPLAEARARFGRALRRAVEASGSAPAAVVTHGTVAGAFLGGLRGAPADPFSLWAGLPFAGVAVVDAEEGRLVAPFAARS